MTAYTANALLSVALLAALLWAVRVLLDVIVEEHRTGVERLHRGRSWEPHEDDSEAAA